MLNMTMQYTISKNCNVFTEFQVYIDLMDRQTMCDADNDNTCYIYNDVDICYNIIVNCQ